MPYVLTCQRALGAYVPTCQHVLHAYVLTCQRVLRAYMLTCQRALCAYVSRANVPSVLMCPRVNVSCMLMWSHTNMPCVLTSSCAITTNNKNKFSITCLPCNLHISWWLSSTHWEVHPYTQYGQKYNRPLYFLYCLTNKRLRLSIRIKWWLSLSVITNRFTWYCLPLAFVILTGKIFFSSYAKALTDTFPFRFSNLSISLNFTG